MSTADERSAAGADAEGARQISDDEVAEPTLPDKVWVHFHSPRLVCCIRTVAPDHGAPYVTIPARLVPLDGSMVVLDREELAGLCDQARQLCYAIEAIPAGEEQTAASVRGSDLSRALRRLIDDAALAEADDA